MNNNKINEFFEKEKIEYYAILDYNDLHQINPRIIERKNIEAKSVIIFLIPYYAGETVNLSKYAAAKDYHLYIKGITERLIQFLRAEYPENSFFGFGDHSPIDERYAALVGGLGILGENGLLINEKYGTYVFVADVISDLPKEKIGASAPKAIKKCKNCNACKNACPTGILAGKSAVCLSFVTQKKGELSEDEIKLIKENNTVWGCDVCQDVCPYNKDTKQTPIDFFKTSLIKNLTKEILDSMDEEEFSERAFAWRGRKTVLRNLELKSDE